MASNQQPVALTVICLWFCTTTGLNFSFIIRINIEKKSYIYIFLYYPLTAIKPLPKPTANEYLVPNIFHPQEANSRQASTNICAPYRYSIGMFSFCKSVLFEFYIKVSLKFYFVRNVSGSNCLLFIYFIYLLYSRK